MWAAARAIDADRKHTDEVVRMFVPLAEGPMAATYVNGKKGLVLPATGATAGSLPSGMFAACYLVSVSRGRAQNQPVEKVEEAYSAALGGAPDFFPAVEANVTYLLSQEKFTQATTLIDALMKASQTSGPSATPAKAWQLQIESEEAQQRYLRALQLAQEAKAKFPDNVDLRMELVQVYRLRGQDKDADTELQAIVQDMPKYETAYRSLVNSLFVRSRRGDSKRQAWRRLWRCSTSLPRRSQIRASAGSRLRSSTPAAADMRRPRRCCDWCLRRTRIRPRLWCRWAQIEVLLGPRQ